MKIYRGTVLTPVIAPYQFTVLTYREILERKYGELAKHLDRAFDRWIVNGRITPVIHGSTIYGAIKRSLRMEGKPLNGVVVICGIIDENDIAIMQKSMIVKGKKTVINLEIVRAGAKIKIYGDLEKLKEIVERKKIVIQVGGKRRFGYGLIELDLEPLGDDSITHKSLNINQFTPNNKYNTLYTTNETLRRRH